MRSRSARTHACAEANLQPPDRRIALKSRVTDSQLKSQTRWLQDHTPHSHCQLRSSIIYILLFALTFDAVVWVLEGADGWPFESLAIATILVFNTATAYGLIAGALAVSVLGATISARLTSEKI